MPAKWGIVGCAYMAKEYSKVLLSKGVKPQIYSRNLGSSNVQSFVTQFPSLRVSSLVDISEDIENWIVCTSIESHEHVCSMLQGRIYCEKPYAHTNSYDVCRNITILMNRRYYHWVKMMADSIARQEIVKIITCIPEKSVEALITQSIHVIDLLWHLTGPFGPATRIGDISPSFIFSTQRDIPVVVNMNYGSHENFSMRFYARDGRVYEAKPLEAFCVSEAMEVREPDELVPVRTYKPVVRQFPYVWTTFKPGLSELIDDLVCDLPSRLPTIEEHRAVHSWMAGYMQ
jgi:predicted dehydrogenase